MKFLTPKWLKDEKATEKLTDEKQLQRAYLEGETREVRATAVSRMNDSSFLQKIFEEAQETELREAACRRFARTSHLVFLGMVPKISPEFLHIIPEELTKKEIQLVLPECSYDTAIKILNAADDPELISIVAKDDHQETRIRRVALSRINDRETVKSILEKCQPKKGVSRLLEDIEDPILCEEIIRSDAFTAETKAFLLSRTQNDDLYSEILRDPESPLPLLKQAVKLCTDSSLVRSIADNEKYDPEIRGDALSRSQLSQQELLDYVWNSPVEELRINAAYGIRNQEELLRMRNNIKINAIQKIICERLGHKYETGDTKTLRNGTVLACDCCIYCGDETGYWPVEWGTTDSV